MVRLPGDSTSPCGIVVVDKPAGLTSHDVVARVRRLANTRRVGHAGTLDPMATGVLVVGINRATRLLGYIQQTTKRYAATVQLGIATDTDDAEGQPVGQQDASHLSLAQVRAAFATQLGVIDQVPTTVSAIKVAGRRAYELARAGESVELSARQVHISELNVVEVAHRELAELTVVEAQITVTCSAGTYIRAIARDVGELLGVGGHLTELRRLAVGEFGVDSAQTLPELEREFTYVPIAEVARKTFVALNLTEEQAIAVRVGRALPVHLPAAITALFAPDGQFLALYRQEDRQEGSIARPAAVFVG